MRKIFYSITCLTIICSASSCSKQCVQCEAKDKYGVTITKSDVICDGNLNRKNFENRFQTQFSGYNTACTNVNN